MIEAVRREKRERDAMRAEELLRAAASSAIPGFSWLFWVPCKDKFTDATDPVVTSEQRMQQQVDRAMDHAPPSCRSVVGHGAQLTLFRFDEPPLAGGAMEGGDRPG